MNTSNKSPTTNYFIAADILGFSQMVANLSADKQDERIADWIEIVEATKQQAGIGEVQLISDTLFVREEDSDAGLARLLKFAQHLLEQGVKNLFF